MQDAIPAAVAAALARAEGGAAVACHETHCSWVLVAGDRALKVKKPIVLSYLDYGTLERRHAMCREEVRLNRRLAPALYRGTVSIVARDGGAVALDPYDDAPGAVEFAVDMRRYEEGDTLAERLRAGAATPGQLRAVGARLAGFHAAEPRPQETEPAFAALRAAVRTTLDDLEADAGAEIDDGRVPTLRVLMEAALAARRAELLERGRRGLVVDGHGDLRAQHVLVTDPVQVVDALEFDAALRIADVSCDLGFLVMDLEGVGADDLATALVDGYREAGGDPGDRQLLATMGCYRALVRAKVDLARGGHGHGRARERLDQALRLGWRARGPQLIAVWGPPASGKSTLARELCAQSGMAHVSSDVVRKARIGLAPTDRAPAAAYGHEATLATYRDLGQRAAAAMSAGRGAVIDATLGDPAARDALRDGLGPPTAARLRYVECRVPTAEAARRARARERDAGRESDAGVDVAARLASAWAALDEVSAERHLVVRADRPVGDVARDVGAWLDRTWA
ncbi:MAG TPA: AAA family ATPase [Solirubrobacteraceae bacterium]